MLVATLLAVAALAPTVASAQDAGVETTWRLLDYIGVDYAGAVAEGRIVSEAEYAEMQEFAASVEQRISQLPPSPETTTLTREAATLKAAIAAKAPSEEVARHAHGLAARLLAAHPVPVAPGRAPDLAAGGRLYAEQCASCHGVSGGGDGPAAIGLDPPPIAFADPERADQRSVFGLYQVIGQGLDGTAMTSFAHLSSDERWALAFYVGRFAYSEADAAAGEALWTSDPAVRARIPDLKTLAQLTPEALAAQVGDAKARRLTAYLRRHPEAVAEAAQGERLSVARMRLAESLSAYRAGDPKRAEALALSAYLDGFEPVEPSLRARDAALMTRVEAAMGALRNALRVRAPESEVAAKVQHLNGLFDAVERVMAPTTADTGASFAAAFTILLREGLEALLIVVAMIAFLTKADRRDALPYVHGGWIGALVAGILTWVAATYLISISGASRELTEGLGSLIAAVVLVSVGIWMHGKAHADAWQHYIREQLSRALSRGSGWFLFLMAFVVVYREVFETILFFTALWAQGGHAAIGAGGVTAVAVLGVVAWVMLRYSRRLPLSKFFTYSAYLMAMLAVVLTGKGVAALQEAGWLDVRPVHFPRIELIGLYPSVAGLVAQISAIAILGAAFWLTRTRTPAIAKVNR